MNAHCGANTYTAGKKNKLDLLVLNDYFDLEGLCLIFRHLPIQNRHLLNVCKPVEVKIRTYKPFLKQHFHLNKDVTLTLPNYN